MDHCVKLTRLMKQGSCGQFSTRLAHYSSMLRSHHWLTLLLETVHYRVNAPSKYIDLILKHDIEINSLCNKSKHTHFVGKTPLMAACQMFNFQAVSSILKHKAINVATVDAQGRNCLFYALKNESEEDCYQMIRTIVNIDHSLANSTDLEGTSILIQAIQKKSLRVVELLLNSQADPNFQCKQTGNTALHQALLSNSTNPQKRKDIILLLLSFKADPSLQNKLQKSCYDIAKQKPQSGWFLELQKQNQQIEQPVVCQLEMNSLTKQDQNSINENILSQVYSESDSSNSQQFSLQKLTTEIDNNSRYREKYHLDSWKDIQYIYEELRRIGENFSLEISIIGSYATGLWTYYSDIDIVFTNMQSRNINIENMLDQIHEILLKRTRELGIKEMYINKNLGGNTFPNIKIDLEPKLGSRKIDITIFQKKNNGQKYVQFIQERLLYYPLIKPVFYAIQWLLRAFNLNHPSRNGVKTYTIFLMILFCAENFKPMTSGQLFMNTVYFYSHCFDYQEDEDGIPKINIIDPLNQYNNVGGRKTDVVKLREMFKAADYGLRLASGKNILEYLCELNILFRA